MGNPAMTPESMEAFIDYEKGKGASENMLRRFKAAVKSVYDFLPGDKELTRERLLEWREFMNGNGYSFQTVQNYVKYLNRYLDFAGYGAIKFMRGKSKNIAGMEFGFITAIEPTEKRDRGDVVWLCKCKCGTELELPAARLIQNNTLSCGCIQKELIKRVNKYFAGTSLEKSLNETVCNPQNSSGYVGVTKKRGKWQAYITYRKQHISLGAYDKLEDAVKARARGKEAVMEDAAELLELYEEMHAGDEALPSRATEPKKEIPSSEKLVNNQPASAARRMDNASGYTGVVQRKNKWEATISHKKTRYILGRFDTPEEAVSARKSAEELLREDSENFIEYYSAKCRHYAI